ncbi:sigma factor-like helix-turn-helix DNA-binding protein [Haloarchaeobius sp. DYHT-AS-18]|uniref:MarR family transcriptional regulator n=1 Tax=Haloarchaeobius sp. DYHT-AS-18 TaxID=3446117 RepID=UPI003EB7EBE4
MTGARTENDGVSFPKSIRHRQILDVAEENPDASIEELASLVPSATADLVEHVFEEYGDPAAEDDTPTEPAATTAADDQPSAHGDTDDDKAMETNETETNDPDEQSPTVDATEVNDSGKETNDANSPENATPSETEPSLDELSAKQREVLTAVAAQPTATQQEIGDRLDVTGATVSNRVNSIEGFDWSERESFVDAVFDERPSTAVPMTGESTTTETNQTESHATDEEATVADATTDVESALERIEARLADLEAARGQTETNSHSVFEDPALVHKVIHACMDAETISKDEELQVIKGLLE